MTQPENASEMPPNGPEPLPSRAGNLCKSYEWMVGPMMDGELPAGEAEAVEGHLRVCPACTRIADDFRSLARLATRVEAPPAVSVAEWANVWENVIGARRVVPLTVRRGVLDWLVPALSLAALLVVGGLLTLRIWHAPARYLDKSARSVIEEPTEGAHPTAFPPTKKSDERKAPEGKSNGGAQGQPSGSSSAPVRRT